MSSSRKSTNSDQFQQISHGFRLSRCAPFEENVTITNDFVKIICTADNRLLIYENVHAPITIKNNVKAKLKLMENKESVFSVLLMGIDSVSRLNFIRSLPNSHKFLVDHDWISLKGYNKVADNTYPNVMAFLTGYNEPDAFTKCKPKTVGGLDKCPLLWYDFRRLGYATAYAEDESWMSTFNLHKEGFKESPTDYYFRPYFLASATLETVKYDGLMYCTGPETSGERVLNLAKDFATAFIDNPSFGLFWMNSFSHNDLNGPSRMDDKIKQFLQDITNAGVLEKSFVIFLSDHGLRFGPFQDSFMGWLEDRLPFIYLWVPRGFIRKFPREYMHLKDNVHKLTTPYDLYMTLQHLLVLSGRNYNTTPSLACPKCKSLFSEIEADRSCEDVGIDQHWCSCTDFNPINQNAQIVQKASLYVLDQIHNTIRISRGDHICARFSLKKIVTASVSKNVKDTKYILLVIETKPTAKFEVTLMYKQRRTGPVFKVKGGISRTDRYALTSKCTNRPMLQKFCYCL